MLSRRVARPAGAGTAASRRRRGATGRSASLTSGVPLRTPADTHVRAMAPARECPPRQGRGALARPGRRHIRWNSWGFVPAGELVGDLLDPARRKSTSGWDLQWWRRRESNRTKGLTEKPNKVASLAGIAFQNSPIHFADGCRPLPSCSVLGSRVTARVQHWAGARYFAARRGRCGSREDLAIASGIFAFSQKTPRSAGQMAADASLPRTLRPFSGSTTSSTSK
jgi:hypothetical protein